MDQYSWTFADIAFEVLDDLTDDPVVTIRVDTPVGLLLITGEPVIANGVLTAAGVHIQGSVGNGVGRRNLLLIARVVMERMGLDGLVVEGAVRTTGAGPGRRPRVLRFTRRVPAATADGA